MRSHAALALALQYKQQSAARRAYTCMQFRPCLNEASKGERSHTCRLHPYPGRQLKEHVGRLIHKCCSTVFSCTGRESSKIVSATRIIYATLASPAVHARDGIGPRCGLGCLSKRAACMQRGHAGGTCSTCYPYMLMA